MKINCLCKHNFKQKSFRHKNGIMDNSIWRVRAKVTFILDLQLWGKEDLKQRTYKLEKQAFKNQSFQLAKRLK